MLDNCDMIIDQCDVSPWVQVEPKADALLIMATVMAAARGTQGGAGPSSSDGTRVQRPFGELLGYGRG